MNNYKLNDYYIIYNNDEKYNYKYNIINNYYDDKKNNKINYIYVNKNKKNNKINYIYVNKNKKNKTNINKTAPDLDIVLQSKMSKIRVCWMIAVYRAIENRKIIIIRQTIIQLEIDFKKKIKSANLVQFSIPTLDEYLFN
jgi:hypothetical protein